MDPLNDGQETPTPEPTKWDRIASTSPRTVGTKWDRIANIPDDPRKQQTTAILNEGATIEPKMAARVLAASNRLGLPEPFIQENIDSVEAEEKRGGLATKDLVDTNPALAEAISKNPHYAAMALGHLGNWKKLEMLYTRHPSLWPLSEGAASEQDRFAAKILAERQWKAQGGTRNAPVASEFAPPEGYDAASQQELEDIIYKNLHAEHMAEQGVIGGSGQMGALESAGNVLRENPLAPIPFLSHAIPIVKNLDLQEAMKREEARGAATIGSGLETLSKGAAPAEPDQQSELDRYFINRHARLQGAMAVRGKSFGGHLAEAAVTTPAMIGEMAAGGSFGRSASGLLGMSGRGLAGKAFAAITESTAAAGSAGLPQMAEQTAGGMSPGDAALSTFIDYASAHVFGPWFSKATPEVQAAVKKSLLKAFPVEAAKMIGMGEVGDLAKGAAGIKPLELPDVVKMLGGDTEAAKRVGTQAAAGGFLGMFHAVTHNARLAQMYAEASVLRGELLHEGPAADSPETSLEIAGKLATGGPNEKTLIPARALKDYYERKGVDPAEVAAKLTGNYEGAIRSGADMEVPTHLYDHVIGADPEASKFFANEIRPEAGALNLREAQWLEKAYSKSMEIPDAARQRIVEQIVEQAKGDKTREAVGRARLDQSGEALLSDRSHLGLSDEQVARISKVVEKAQQTAEEAVNAKERERRDALKSDLYANELGRIREQVTREVDARAEQKALAYLQSGKLPNGGELPQDAPRLKLDPAATEAMLNRHLEGVPEGTRKLLGLEKKKLKKSDLPRGIFAKEGGLDPDAAAGIFGFDSGEALLEALHGTDRSEAIDSETKSRMDAKFPNGLTPSELSNEAMKAAHNEHSAELGRLALDAIENKLKAAKDVNKLVTRRAPKKGVVSAEAEADIQSQPISRINPDIYLDAEKRAGREIQAAIFGGKFATTKGLEEIFDKRLEQLHAHERYRFAQKAIEANEKTVKGWIGAVTSEGSALNKPDTYDFGQQVKGFLSRIGLYAPTREEMATKKPFAQWAAEKLEAGETNGEPIYIDPKFADESKPIGDYRDLTPRDIASLKITIDQIRHLAKSKNEVVVLGNKIALQGVVSDLSGEIKSNFKELPPQSLTESSRSFGEKAKGVAKEIDAALYSPEPWFDRNGGGKIDSEWNRQYSNYVEARIKEDALRRQFSEASRKAWADLPKEEAKAFDRKVTIPGVRVPLSLREIANIVANGGNESNYSKMIRGEAIPAELGGRDIGLTEEKIQEAATHLSEFQKDHVQKILDITNMFWSEIEKLHIWATGRPPEKIEAKQMIKAMGDRPGGYYPAMYDRRFSKVGEMQIAKEAEVGKLFPKSWVSATTDGGYRESRAEGFAAPMDFDFGRLASHTDSMIKDIAYRRWLLDFNKIVSSREIRDAIRDHQGKEYQSFLGDWAKRAIGQNAHPSDASMSRIRRIINAARHNITIATLGLRASTVLHHALGADLSIAEVGAKNFMSGMGEFLSAPKDKLAQMAEESPDLAHYAENFDPNVHEALARLEGNTSKWADFQRFCMKGIQYANMLRAVPAYFGAKTKARAELSAQGKTGAELETLARQYAQRTVRTTVGSGKAGDLPAIMTSPFAKTMLMFYTPGRLRYSQARNLVGDIAQHGFTGDAANKAIFKAFWMLPAAAVLHTLVSGKLPDEEKDETYLGMYAKDMATYTFSPLPLGSEIANAVVDMASGKKHDTGISSPIMKGLEQAFDAVHKTQRWHEDEAEFEDVFRSFSRTAGYFFGAPTEQAEITAGQLLDMARGKGEDPNDIWEFLHDVLWRRPKSRR